MSNSPTDVVTAFLALWAQPGGLDRSVRDHFTADTVWENVGLATTRGIDEALALNAQMEAALGLAAIRVDMLAIAAVGDTVLTERIDHMLDAAGRVLHSAPVMGAFELAGTRIVAWRDYFDSAGAAALMQGSFHEE